LSLLIKIYFGSGTGPDTPIPVTISE